MTDTDTPTGFLGSDPDDNGSGQGGLVGDDRHAAELAYEWLEWHRDVADHSERTYGTYARIMLKWLEFCDAKDINPLRPTTTDLEAFMTRPRPKIGNRKGSAATQALDAKCLRGFFNWCDKRRYLAVNPSVDLRAPKAKRRNPRPVKDHDWQLIWGSDLPPRLRAVIGLGYYAGLRRDEIQNLHSTQVTPTRLVNFVRKGGGEDTLPWRDMADAVAERLPHLLPDVDVLASAVEYTRQRDYMFSQYSSGHALWKRITKLCDDLGVDHYSPHQLRHSTATNLIEAGIPVDMVMTLMNHADINTTLLYVRNRSNGLRAFLDMTRER